MAENLEILGPENIWEIQEENMDWTEVKIAVPAKDVDRAGDIAQMVVPYGIYIED